MKPGTSLLMSSDIVSSAVFADKRSSACLGSVTPKVEEGPAEAAAHFIGAN